MLNQSSKNQLSGTSSQRTYVYVRVSPKDHELAANKQDIFTQYPHAELIEETGVRGYVPLQERPAFLTLQQKLQPGDTIVVWWIDSLGHDFLACYRAISTLLTQGIIVKTLSQNLTFQTDDTVTDALLSMLQGFASSHTQKRLNAAHLARQQLKDDLNAWKSRFKGRPANTKMHQNIAELLLAGHTLQATADKLGVSVSTVKRVKAKLNQKNLI
ncbi:MAG: recombinase family protein [Vibrio sp.]